MLAARLGKKNDKMQVTATTEFESKKNRNNECAMINLVFCGISKQNA